MIQIKDVGWITAKEGYRFFITCLAGENEVTLHSKDVYGSRTAAVENAHKTIAAFGWKYEEEES